MVDQKKKKGYNQQCYRVLLTETMKNNQPILKINVEK